MNFSKIKMGAKGLISLTFILLLSMTVQAQEVKYQVSIDDTTIELIEHLNTSELNPDNLSDQVALAKVNLDKAYKIKKYDEETYDDYMMRLLDVEEELHQLAIENRLKAAQSKNMQQPKIYENTDLAKAKQILKKKLESGVIDQITYMKRMKKLEEKSDN